MVGHGKTEAENDRITHDCAFKGMCDESPLLGGIGWGLSHPLKVEGPKALGASLGFGDDEKGKGEDDALSTSSIGPGAFGKL